MRDRVRVAFACNDPESGHRRLYFDAVEISEPGGETLVSLMGDLYEDERTALKHAPRIEGGHCSFLRVMGQLYRVRRFRQWEGNWCWDACDMSVTAARYLLRRLLKAGFQVDEWVGKSPFEDLLLRES